MNKQELFEQMEELLDEYLLAAEMQETIPEEIEEEEELQEESDGEMQEESDEEILKLVRN
jgi:hypothetical protein